MMWPFKRRPDPAAQVQVGVMYPSGDISVLWPGEGVPRVWPAELAAAIAEQVNRNAALYAQRSESVTAGAADRA